VCKMWLTLLLAIFASGTSMAWAAASAEELQKQSEFKKTYKALDKEEDLKALVVLDGATDRGTWQLLGTVIQTSTFKDVKVEAFKLLSAMPTRDQNLATMLVQIFQSTKINDFETRVAYAEQMRNSEFKYLVVEALVEHGTRLRYPELVTGYRRDNNAGGGNGIVNGDPNQGIRKQRAEFEQYVEAFNKVIKSDVAAKDKDSNLAFKKWWNESRVRILNADKAILEKYRQEDLASANKNNPLVPKGKKDDAKEEKPEDKKDEKKDEKKG